MERQHLKPVRLFCSDLDGTLVGDEAATRRFHEQWMQLPDRPVLVYSSGRLVDDMRDFVREAALPMPDFIIGGVGTMIFDVLADNNMEAFFDSLSDGWDIRRVQKVMAGVPGIERQPRQYQNERKSSWYLHNAGAQAIAAIETALAEAGLKARVVYSSRRDLDILPQGAAKGSALAWLCASLGIDLDATIVAGDTGNDASMFMLRDVRGILVGNALPELVDAARGSETFHAKEEAAAGVIAGLKHYGVFG